MTTVRSEEETLNRLLAGSSISRFGDGEFTLAFYGGSLPFQSFHPELAGRLLRVLSSEAIDVAIPPIYSGLDHLNPDWANRSMWSSVATSTRPLLPDREYSSSFVSRPELISGLLKKEYFDKFCQLWSDRDVVFVGNYRIVTQPGWRLRMATTLDIEGHPLFSCARIKVVPAPQVDAFQSYESILDQCLKLSPSSLFLLSLGPTATILAEDLVRRGRQALDFGQLLMVYGFYADKVQPKYVSSEEWARRS